MKFPGELRKSQDDGGEVKESTKKREAYFLEYANKARKLVSTPLVVTGGFRSQEGMTEAIASGTIDMVGLAKPFALVPDLPNQIFEGKYETVKIKPIKTGITSLDKKASSMLELGWYEQQLARIGKSKLPKPNYSVWLSLLHNISKNGLSVFKKEEHKSIYFMSMKSFEKTVCVIIFFTLLECSFFNVGRGWQLFLSTVRPADSTVWLNTIHSHNQGLENAAKRFKVLH